MRGKCDPSRGAGRGRRVAGRGGQGPLGTALMVGHGRLGPFGGERPRGIPACSRHGRGHMPRSKDGCHDRWRRGCSTASERAGRSPTAGLNRQNSRDRPYRVGRHNRALTPRLSRSLRYPNAGADRQRRGCGRRRSPWQGRPQGAWKTARGFPQRPQPSSSQDSHEKTGWPIHKCREFRSGHWWPASRWLGRKGDPPGASSCGTAARRMAFAFEREIRMTLHAFTQSSRRDPGQGQR